MLSTLLHRVNTAAQNLNTGDPSSAQHIQAHADLRHATERLLASLSDPEEEAWRFMLAPAGTAAAVAASKCGILSLEWPEEVMSAERLGECKGVDGKLAARLMRAICVYGVLEEVGEGTYRHNALSRSLAMPMNGGMFGMASNLLLEISQLPDWLENLHWQNPGTSEDHQSLFQYTHKTPLDFFPYLQSQPEKLAAFNQRMVRSLERERQSLGQKGFAAVFPFEEELGSDPNETVLVDVGGGYGHVLHDVRRYCPELKGKVVLEDLPETVKGHMEVENMEVVPYDFFESVQPIKGARAYLLRHVLHDWADRRCITILENLIPAMEEGKSRLLVAEIVLPSMKPPPFGTMMDINMMRYMGAGRTEREWRDLLQRGGFRVVKIWDSPSFDSMIEAVPLTWKGT